MSNKRWSDEENAAVVADYLSMLVDSLKGVAVNKSARRRTLVRTSLPNRSESSIERKRQNVSAVLVLLGYDYLDGYVPLFNVQRSLRQEVESQLRSRRELDFLLSRKVEALEQRDPNSVRLELVLPPKHREILPRIRDWGARERTPGIPNYGEVERRNRLLGRAGELAVLEFERQRLREAGAEGLASKVEHVSESRGDGLGFDILSFETDGRERLVEVKTTKFGEYTPFHVSRNELEVSRNRASVYHLYRLYRFDDRARIFMLKGALNRTCILDPSAYLAEVGLGSSTMNRVAS